MTTWWQYREEAFGDPYLVWHDGPYFDEFLRRWRDEPELAERMLRQGIAEGEPLAAQTVREIAHVLTDEQKVALGGLLLGVEMLHPGTARIQAARSLYSLTGDPGHAAALVDELHGVGFWSVRLDAAMLLRDFPPTPELVASLRDAVADDPEYLVRNHAANTLRRWAGESSDISDERELFAMILDSSTPEQRAHAADVLAARVRA